MKYVSFLSLIIVLFYSCKEDTTSISYPAKYEYTNAEFPTDYSFFAIGSDSMASAFNPVGSSMEEAYNFLLNTDLDTSIFEDLDENMSHLFSFELLNDSELIITVWNNGLPIDTTTTYEIIDGVLEVEGLNFSSSDFKILYNEAKDRFELVFSLEYYSHYLTSSGTSVSQTILQYFGDVSFGDTDDILSRYQLSPQDSIGIGFGHFVWEKS